MVFGLAEGGEHVAIVVEIGNGTVTSIGGDQGPGSAPTGTHVTTDGPYPSVPSPNKNPYMGMPLSGYVSPRGLVDPPAPPAAHPPAVAVSGDGGVRVFWRGEGGLLWQGTGAGTGALKGTRLGSGPMQSGPAAGADAQGHVYVFWTGTDGNLCSGFLERLGVAAAGQAGVRSTRFGSGSGREQRRVRERVLAGYRR